MNLFRSPHAFVHIIIVAALVAALVASGAETALAAGVLRVTVKDRDTEKPIAARITLIGPRGRPVPVRRATDAGVGWAFDGNIDLEVPSGRYQFQLTHGPEYRVMNGHFVIDRTADDSEAITLERFVDTKKENWLSGDLCVEQNLRPLPLLMRAEEIDVVAVLGITDVDKAAPAIGKTPDDESLSESMQIKTDNRLRSTRDGGLLMLGMQQDLVPVPETDPSVMLLAGAHAKSVEHFVVTDPFAWDLPLWLASGKIDGYALLGDFLQLDRSITKVTQGRPNTDRQYDTKLGLGFRADDIYQSILEAGFRIVPVACSGSGIVKNPVGYNRVLVQCPDKLNANAFWDGLWQGRSVVTNGPLLRPRLDEQYPGHVFTAEGSEPLKLQMDLQLGVRDPVEYLEVIYNGDVIYSARLSEFVDNKGIIPRFEFDRSGWVIARVVTGYEKHYRAAVSAPWWIDFPDQRRISRQAVQFFIDWQSQRETMLKTMPADYVNKVAPFVRASRQFWQARLDQATVD